MSNVDVYNTRPSLVVLPPVQVGGRVVPPLRLMPGKNSVPAEAWSAALKIVTVQKWATGKNKFLSTNPADMPDMKEIPRLKASEVPPEKPDSAPEGVEYGSGFSAAGSVKEVALRRQIQLQQGEMDDLKAQLAAMQEQLKAALAVPPLPQDAPVEVEPERAASFKVKVEPLAKKAEPEAPSEPVILGELTAKSAKQTILETTDVSVLEGWLTAEERKTVRREINAQLKRLRKLA